MKSITALCLWLFASTVTAQTLTLDCRVQYEKGGDLWHRAVALIYDKNKLREVRIDGQAVYTFNHSKDRISTSVDNERIQIEFAKKTTTWRSNFRELSFGSGLCVKSLP